MKLDELFGIGDSAEQKELKQLSLKVKGMYEKSLDNLEKVIAQNAKAFKEQPLEAFTQWFESFFDRPIKRVIDNDSLANTIREKNIQKLIKPLVMLASQNYYLKPKTGYGGAKSLLSLAPMVAKQDRETQKTIEKFFGSFVEKGSGSQNDPNPDVKVGSKITAPDGTEYEWKGRMWVDAKQQPAPKELQGPFTQKAIDDGMV